MYTSCIKPNCYCHSATQPHGQNKQAQVEAENEAKNEGKRSTKKYSKKKKLQNLQAAPGLLLLLLRQTQKTRIACRGQCTVRPWRAAPLPLCPPSSPAAFHLLALPATKNFKSISATAFGHYEKKICRKTLNEETKKQLQKTS